MRIIGLTLLLGTAVLSGCDAGSEPPGGAASATLAAAPSPAPSATPSAAPSHAATGQTAQSTVNDYWRFDSLGNDTLFYTVNAFAIMGQPQAAQTFDWGEGFAAQWRVNTKGYTFDYTDPATQTWLPSHITSFDDNVDVYTGAPTGANTGQPDFDRRSFWLYKPFVGTRATWVRTFRRVEGAQRAGTNTIDPVLLYGAMGIPTYPNEGVSTEYGLQIFGSGDFDAYDLWPSIGSIRLNYPTGFAADVNVSIVLRGRSKTGEIVNFGRIRGVATKVRPQYGFSTGGFSFTSAAKTGFRLNGMFFGPGGREIGGTFTVWLPDGKTLVGAFAGLSKCQQTLTCSP